MRLLHFNALGKLILTDFRGKPTPPYAILSHRWGSSEILIEDISNGSYKEKEEGYQKLRFCAEQAAQDGLQYFWIDTCCIDRWNNNERSKAINSMFQWYKKAVRCYVFLSDVSASTSTSTGFILCRDWNVSLRRSKWFTRGWTLQELIAPASQPGAMSLLGAVSQAAACMNASNMTVQQYQARLHEHDQAALKHSSNLHKGEQGESSLQKAVAATLSLSIGQIQQSNTIAVEQLYFAACVERKDILLDLFKTASPQACVDAITTLDRYALITRRPAESAFDVHRLVHQALREQLQVRGRLHEYTQRTVTQLLQVFPNNDHSNRSKWRRLLPHAQYTLSHSEKNDDEERTNLIEDCAHALQSDGQYKRAKELYVQVMESRTRVLGSKHPDTLNSVSNLGLVLSSQGKYNEAEVVQRQALEGFEDMLGREHPYTLASVGNLGLLLLSQGKYEEAETTHRRALEAREKVLGREHPHTLNSINSLGSALSSQGKYEEAETTYRRVIEAREKILGREHPHTLNSISSLGSALSSQGKYEEAEAMHQRALEAREKILGREHPDTLNSVRNLGSLLSSQGKYDEAEVMHRRALEVREKVLGREHPDTLASTNDLGVVLESKNRYKDAEIMHRRALEGYEKVLGREHPFTLISLGNLRSVLEVQNKYEAEAIHE
ncbi:hypothetical protein COCC4DRAFT_175767 [Bipolaris maydis ATCC 48331]|uniref:Heterokaryon incompatibility domain-containing protein n=1 Tax=Cochliobolus heterostrophus (strain C4 / ATCC 48331 / race T) TaxID=665024 RepID=N4X617_COCH4|nr:uncharacterized protein COCC4DRAFT_175767 [Bipolaris maydis ATCC 48331]ENI01986.1 hypothetical protein COCC4DRAFT_175767 [Bipolaris maydis ATCC 48331]